MQNEMATRIAIDTVSAANSLKGLQNAVSAATSAWKAQETALRSAGNSLGAARTKYEGLGNVIDSQKRKIEELKNRQSGLNVENQKDAETYLKLQKNIDTATKQLSSYEAQQSRAKQAVGYHTSGLADLQKGYRQSNELSKSFVDRLQAEGRASEANKAKLSGLKQGISNLSAQYKVQESELKRIASETGKTSDAYKKQQTRLNETATAMAKTKTEARELENQLNKKPAGFLGGIKEKLLGVNKSAEKTESVFKRVFSGVFWGEVAHGAASSALNLIKAGLGGITKAGNEFNKEQQVMNATWTTLTGNASKGASFVKSINNMSTAFGQSNDLVNELDQQFYHVLDKKGPTEQLTKSVLTMADTLGMSAENTKRLGLNFTHMMSSSKMQLGDFNMISDQLPMFGERLLDYERKMQHNNALSMSELRDQMSAGKISAKDAEAVMNGLGKKYKDASENMMKTATGAERSIKARFGALSGDLAKPFTTMQSPIFEAVSKWVSDPKTEKKFTEVGKAASKGFQTTTTALTKALDIKDGPKAMNKFMDGLAKSIESISNMITSHSKQIVGFFKGLWSTVKILGKVGAGFFKGLVGAVEAVANPLAKMVSHNKKISGLSEALGELAKHTSALETLGKILAGVFVTKKIVGFTSSLVTAGIKVKDFSKGLIFKPTVDPETGKRQLTLFAKTVKGTAKLIGKSLKWTAKIAGKVAKGAIKGLYAVTRSTGRLIGKSLKWTAKIGKSAASKAISGLQKTVKASGKLIVKSLKFTAKISAKAAVLALNGLKKAAGLTGKAFLQMGKFMLANPFIAIAAAIVAVGVAFYELYKHNKKFKKFIDGIGKSITKFTKGALKGIKKFFKSFKKSWDNFWSGLGKGINKTWKGITGGISKQYTKINKGLSSFSKNFKKGWDKHWNDSKKSLSDTTKKMNKTFTGWGKDMSKNWDSWKKGFSKNWNKHWNSTKDYLSDRWDDMKKSSSKWGTSISKWFSGWGDDFKKSWSSLIGSVKKMFSGLWDDMKKLAGGGINAVSGVINTGIKGVNGVVHLFGGKENTISKIPDVKFATGTGSLGASSFRRAITQITPAIVNDEVGARNPELIFRKSTGNVEFLKGQNAKTVLFPGDEVANATDSAMLAPMLGLTPFAKGGIGSFFGGLWNGVTGFVSDVSKKLSSLWNTGKKIISNPAKALESLMPFSKGGAKGFFPTMVKGGFNFVKKAANNWWSNLWSMVNLDGNDGTGSYGGGWQSPGSGWVKTDGFGSSRGKGVHDGNDFSASIGTPFHAMHGGTVIRVGSAPSGWGPVGYDIVTKDSTGKEIIYQEFGNAKDVKVHEGQHVSTGDVLGKLGRSGLGTGPHLHVGLTNGGSVWSRNGYSTKGWLDITKQHGKDTESDAKSDAGSKTDSKLQATIKKQVGSGFWKTISKLASMFGDSGEGGSGSSPSGKMSMSEFIKVAHQAANIGKVKLSPNDIKRLYWQAHVESGVNPAVGGGYDDHDGTGLPVGLFQYKKGTWNAWAKSGYRNIHSALDQIITVIRDSNWRSDLAPYGVTRGWGPTGHKAFENGGVVQNHQLIEVAEGNKPEMIIPLDVTKRSRAHELIQEAVARTTPNEPVKTSASNNDTNNRSLQNLEAKFDTLLAMFAKLLGLNADQLEAIKNSGQLDMKAWYRKQARDQANADFQGL
ncbi:tape measure protein [Pediococcus pentosaceus]|uniref:tape measure protein n=1 Tax=Pediococcus pentosaceus TaxID=1255 RepID=UPI001FDAA134|nr:tape measure protein [Pediococcus pentosaceus]